MRTLNGIMCNMCGMCCMPKRHICDDSECGVFMMLKKS
ncbi:MAG: hypothetical protein K0S76_784 [Herbinix sp.]|jgi:hypothetical protein|nr:hypothetical protein [Herbinix sp.]